MNPGDDIPKTGGGDYQRPGASHRCGRGALWRKPCDDGPTPDGHCGGTAECQPALRNGKYGCRRPPAAGGPCAEGPAPDGTCAHLHPPCIPRLTLRRRRGRITWQLCGLLLLLLAAGFHFGIGTKSRPLAADPGPLSAKHAHFTATQGCAACHAAHDAGPGGLIHAVFATGDPDAKCSGCHTFGGRAELPHNDQFHGHNEPRQTECRMCHTEHRGANARLTTLTDAQCHTCHQVKFQSFARGHPPFSDGFPHRSRAAVRFDHGKHLGDYFSRADLKARAPLDCAGCHAASGDRRTMLTAGFEPACARCHAEQIPQNELVLLRLPEPTPAAELAKLSPDDGTPFMAWMVQRGSTNAGDYGPQLNAWFERLAREGVGTLGGTARFAGLNPELLQRPLALWREQKKFEPAAGTVASGWYWLEDLYPELRYKPAGHADAVARAWVEDAVNVRRFSSESDPVNAMKLRDELTRPATGVGRCFKCHTVSWAADAKGVPRVDWKYFARPSLPHTRFSHAPHLDVMQCGDCHALDPKANYGAALQIFSVPVEGIGVSGFKAITLANCASCHTEKKVRADCSLCHEYHRGPGLLPEMKTAGR